MTRPGHAIDFTARPPGVLVDSSRSDPPDRRIGPTTGPGRGSCRGLRVRARIRLRAACPSRPCRRSRACSRGDCGVERPGARRARRRRAAARPTPERANIILCPRPAQPLKTRNAVLYRLCSRHTHTSHRTAERLLSRDCVEFGWFLQRCIYCTEVPLLAVHILRRTRAQCARRRLAARRPRSCSRGAGSFWATSRRSRGLG